MTGMFFVSFLILRYLQIARPSIKGIALSSMKRSGKSNFPSTIADPSARDCTVYPASVKIVFKIYRMSLSSSAINIFFLLISSPGFTRSEEHTSELQSQSNLVCRLLLEKKKKQKKKVLNIIQS